MTRLPDFLVIGAMKSATSTLHDQLASQPGFFMSDPKEPNFFSDDANYARGWDDYLALFADAAEGDLCGESSTHYTKLPTHPKSVERIRAHLPEVKLIYVMRDPMKRLESQYVHEWTMNVVSGSFGEALRTHPALVAYGRYPMQLQPYLETFGAGRVLPVFMERLTAHPQAELERICAFLGYTGTPRWRDEVGPRNVSKERVRRTPMRDFLIDSPGLERLRRRFVPQVVRDRVKRMWQIRDRPTLSNAERAHLEALYDRDLATLGHWLDLDLRCEGFAERVREVVPRWSDAVARGDLSGGAP